ncbi:MAG: NADPH-dependent F420 reductase [Anaerolineales bacterium]|nr:NADPH-dependent F420 reductase [Anaerolineales bacterium]
MTDRIILTIGLLGGTGNEGQGLAFRWAKAGYHIIIGSRTPEKALRVANELNERLGEDLVEGMGNQEAAELADIIVITVPYSAHAATIESLKDTLKGKVFIDVTVPLVPPNIEVVQMPTAGSAAQEAQEILGEDVSVVAAFQNISHSHLKEEGPVPCDVLVCGDNEAARNQVLELVKAAGLVGWDAGPLQNAVVVEGLTSILLGINKRYKMKNAGIRVTGGQAHE